MGISLLVRLILLFTSALFLQSGFAQDFSRWGLPEGARARIGKGWVSEVDYSPDGRVLASASWDFTTPATWGSIKRMAAVDNSNHLPNPSPPARAPTATLLLPNYPNPFNPEAWIPYQLEKPAVVLLTIYDMRGHAVRTLDVGHQPAGVYHSRERAAHWDGRNQRGETVANGVYFCTLTAREFSATRKMIVGK